MKNHEESIPFADMMAASEQIAGLLNLIKADLERQGWYSLQAQRGAIEGLRAAAGGNK